MSRPQACLCLIHFWVFFVAIGLGKFSISKNGTRLLRQLPVSIGQCHFACSEVGAAKKFMGFPRTDLESPKMRERAGKAAITREYHNHL